LTGAPHNSRNSTIKGADAVKDFRTKLAVAAVVFGLGGLGGYAMSSNPAGQTPITVAPTAAHTQGAPGSPQVTTGASGATSASTINVPASQALPRRTMVGQGGQDD
jgi:hypothetical protein